MRWILWIVADVIYVPMYASRHLYLTALLYAVFVWMAAQSPVSFGSGHPAMITATAAH